jgi:hypothetical protein
VPESAPGPYSLIGWLGQSERTSLHFITFPCASGAQIFFRSSTVMVFAHVLRGLTTTVRASKATGSSMYSMPFFFASSISLARIGREAPATSISPRVNFLKPPPVPEMPTVTLAAPRSFWYSSATASVTG